MDIQFIGQYDNTPNVQVRVRFFEVASSKEVSLADKARLTCNGSDVKPDFIYTHPTPPCLRQPPGGVYRIVYSDEHGAVTTVIAPVPAGQFAILSPRDGSTVKIPINCQFTIRFAVPTAPPKSKITITDAVAWCAESSEHPCNSMMYVAPTAPATTIPGAPTATVFEYRGEPTPTQDMSIPTPTPFVYRAPPTPTPMPGVTPIPPAQGDIITQSGGMGTALLDDCFSEYPPGAGRIQISIAAQITPDRGGFAAASATMDGKAIANITWVR